MEEPITAEIREGMVELKSTSRTQKDWFVESELDRPEVLKANACDLAFFLGCNNSNKRPILIRSIAQLILKSLLLVTCPLLYHQINM